MSLEVLSVVPSTRTERNSGSEHVRSSGTVHITPTEMNRTDLNRSTRDAVTHSSAHITLTYLVLIGCRHSELGRVVRELKLATCNSRDVNVSFDLHVFKTYFRAFLYLLCAFVILPVIKIIIYLHTVYLLTYCSDLVTDSSTRPAY